MKQKKQQETCESAPVLVSFFIQINSYPKMALKIFIIHNTHNLPVLLFKTTSIMLMNVDINN